MDIKRTNFRSYIGQFSFKENLFSAFLQLQGCVVNT